MYYNTVLILGWIVPLITNSYSGSIGFIKFKRKRKKQWQLYFKWIGHIWPIQIHLIRSAVSARIQSCGSMADMCIFDNFFAELLQKGHICKKQNSYTLKDNTCIKTKCRDTWQIGKTKSAIENNMERQGHTSKKKSPGFIVYRGCSPW